jgi:hypothetical protein
MLYPYNAIFERGLLNTFQAALHSAYLCLKVSAIFGVIAVFSSQKESRNIERSFAPGHKNVNFLKEGTDQPEQPSPKGMLNSRKLKVISLEWSLTPEYQTEPFASEPR